MGVYIAGEIETLAGRTDLAEEQYVRAIELGRVSGATFLVGVATVGLLSVRVSAGRIREALTGYRDVIDYFAGTGNWAPPHRFCTYASSPTHDRGGPFEQAMLLPGYDGHR